MHTFNDNRIFHRSLKPNKDVSVIANELLNAMQTCGVNAVVVIMHNDGSINNVKDVTTSHGTVYINEAKKG